MVILVCGNSDDEQIALLVRSLRRKRVDFLVLEEGTLVNQVQLRWRVVDSGLFGNIRIGSKIFNIHEISGMYHRFVNPEDALESGSSPSDVCRTRSVLRAFMDLFDVLPGRVVNRRRPMMSNNSKPYQALLILQGGFLIPETLITNDAESLRAFACSHDSLVYKSISSTRSIVARLDEESYGRISLLRFLPTQFQRRIKGLNVRVHVVGNRAFATQVLTEATDYRYASKEGAWAKLKPYELTAELRHRCLRLSRLCGLAFAGIDLIISDDGVYCLEVNPSPAYSYYQEATGQRISDSLADYLAKM